MRQKEIINIRDGCRFGFVCDVEFDADSGRITKIIVPGPAKVFGLFGRDKEYCIPWSSITQIGADIILVDVDTNEALTECKD